jgi:FMN phosphatase YigB (HAD superfamily)
MPLTVLIDLDDTLLENDIYKFLPHYLKALGKHLSPFVHPERMAKELLAATDAMAANDDATLTLEEAFDARFYPAIGVEKALLRETLTDFYERVFPELQPLTSPRPAAVRLVDAALKIGHTVVIATNPLFPLRAITHRLAWADLSADRYPFALISSFEKFHYAKPNPGFIAECLGQSGWEDQPAVMIGNSLNDDLLPAAHLGLPGFLVNSSPEPELEQKLPPHSSQGSLEDAASWLKEMESKLETPAFNSIQAVLAILKTTPAVLDTFGRTLSAQCWNEPLKEGEWCFTEIICHLRDADAEINLPRFERILNTANSFVAAVNADAWSETRGYCKESGSEALKALNKVRGSLVERLQNLTPEQWETPASHAIFGPTTLRELAAFMAQHDRTHIQQARRTAQACIAAGQKQPQY